MENPRVKALIARLNDWDSRVHFSAASALVQIGVPAIPALIAAMKNKDLRVRFRAASALGTMGNSVTLPRKILASSQLSAQERIDILDALRGVKYKDDPTTLRYTFPDTPALCQIVLNEGDAEARKGAQVVLNWLNGDRDLVIASQRDPAIEGQELLRAAEAGTSETRPDTLLRASDGSTEHVEQPTKRRTLWERLFGKQRKAAP